MIRYICGMTLATLMLVDVQSGWSLQQFLYSPVAVEAEGSTLSKDGVFVQEVEVQKGDNLYKISRRFSGHGSYYSQILLFNDIKDPNRIYPGNVFRVPIVRNRLPRLVDKVSLKLIGSSGDRTVRQSEAGITKQKSVATVPSGVPVKEVSRPVLEKVDAVKNKNRTIRDKRVGRAINQATTEKQRAEVLAAAAKAGQKLFERAVKAYRRNDCLGALESFDRFLAKNQSSPLAADASLYKADCYLRLSNQK